MSLNPSKLIEVHNSASNLDQPSGRAKLRSLLLVNMMEVPLGSVSLALMDPSSDAGWHCHALECYIRIQYYHCPCSIAFDRGLQGQHTTMCSPMR
uniref:Uncharacterized protein n=1 Tax=Triticum urartu TaxID=4572 RepID=A0A8R7TQF8_TRIUA